MDCECVGYQFGFQSCDMNCVCGGCQLGPRPAIWIVSVVVVSWVPALPYVL